MGRKRKGMDWVEVVLVAALIAVTIALGVLTIGPLL